MAVTTPRLVVFSSLFPSAVQPNAGLFIRERMFRVGKHLPIVVVAPQPWFPGQQLIRWFRPHFRPMALKRETMDGIVVHRPRSFCTPGISEMDRWSVHGAIVVFRRGELHATITPTSSTLTSATRPAMRRYCWDAG